MWILKIREDTENNLLEINIGKSEVLAYQVGMIEKNKELNILEFNNIKENGETVLIFNLDEKKRLIKYLKSKKFSKVEGLKFILDILDIIIEANEYLLFENNFLIDINYMYYDLESSKFKIIYVPTINNLNKDINARVKNFIKELIVDVIEFDDEYQHDGFIGILINFIRSDIAIGDLKKKIEKMIYGNTILKKEMKLSKEEDIRCFNGDVFKEKNITQTNKERKNFNSEDLYSFIEDRNDVIKHPLWIKVCILLLQIIVISGIIFLVLEDLGINILALLSLIFILIDMIIVKFLLQYKVEREESMLVNSEDDFEDKGFVNIGKKEIISQNVCGADILEKTGPYFLLVNDEITERVYITKSNFIIGRLGNECDYVINNNTIGKVHLKVVKDNDAVYIEDLHSKNGTYINEKRMESGQLYKVEENFRIKISNVVLTFREV